MTDPRAHRLALALLRASLARRLAEGERLAERNRRREKVPRLRTVPTLALGFGRGTGGGKRVRRKPLEN